MQKAAKQGASAENHYDLYSTKNETVYLKIRYLLRNLQVQIYNISAILGILPEGIRPVLRTGLY